MSRVQRSLEGAFGDSWMVDDRDVRSFRSVNVDAQAASVALDLGSRRLGRLEECRAGGALTMEMRLWAPRRNGRITVAADADVA